ncbi:hypothetical protein AeMF1_006709 [Aphanomyces euteiches]|nr:hypothetical protein AeMF1_006709 [Aphanomyces euteiches]KAH9180089.1 hypothetical protein AeNC1_017268 [Aphanomyces euteiches]
MHFWQSERGECRLPLLRTKKRHASDEQGNTNYAKRRKCHHDTAAIPSCEETFCLRTEMPYQANQNNQKAFHIQGTPESRRPSSSHEQRRQQHILEIRTRALSSELDVDVNVKQARPMDPKEENDLAREGDSFRRKHEEKYRVKYDYLAEEKCGDINSTTRGILMDWLVKVGYMFNLVPQTLHLAVHLVDRCLSVMKIGREKLQLLGCACMMLACKVESQGGQIVQRFVTMIDLPYTKDDMLAMENMVLETLEYKLAGTHVHHFLERFIQAGCPTETQQHFAHYLAELAVMDYPITIAHPPILTNEKSPWTPTLYEYTTYNVEQVRDCVAMICNIHHAEHQVLQTDPDKIHAVTAKYMLGKYARVSELPPVQPNLTNMQL